MTKLKKRLGQMAVATMLATGLLAVAQIDSADAAFPGKNGVIAFESNRTTGKGVHNPTGDTEIFTTGPDGTRARQTMTATATNVVEANSLELSTPRVAQQRTNERPESGARIRAPLSRGVGWQDPWTLVLRRFTPGSP